MRYLLLFFAFFFIFSTEARPRKRKRAAHASTRSRHSRRHSSRNRHYAKSSGPYKTIWIGPQLVDCQGVSPMKCMMVKYEPDGVWTNYYDAIEGFMYEEGFEYELKIKETKVANPPADASSIKWTLVRLIAKQEPEAPRLPLASQWILASYYEGGKWVASNSKSAYITIMKDLKSFTGTGGCNRLRGDLETSEATIKFTNIISTKMACEKLDAESRFMAALASATRFEINGGLLTLYANQQPIVQLESYR